jgi:hypothetical protein
VNKTYRIDPLGNRFQVGFVEGQAIYRGLNSWNADKIGIIEGNIVYRLEPLDSKFQVGDVDFTNFGAGAALLLLLTN